MTPPISAELRPTDIGTFIAGMKALRKEDPFLSFKMTLHGKKKLASFLKLLCGDTIDVQPVISAEAFDTVQSLVGVNGTYALSSVVLLINHVGDNVRFTVPKEHSNMFAMHVCDLNCDLIIDYNNWEFVKVLITPSKSTNFYNLVDSCMKEADRFDLFSVEEIFLQEKTKEWEPTNEIRTIPFDKLIELGSLTAINFINEGA